MSSGNYHPFARFNVLLPVVLVLFSYSIVVAASRYTASPVLHSHAEIAPGDSTAWVDSIKKVIAKKYTWGYGGPAVIQSQKRYINANMQLADYYAAKYYAGNYSQFASAEKYYWNIAKLTDGTDSDLADEVSVISLRDNGAKKLLHLYLAAKPAPPYREMVHNLLVINRNLLRKEGGMPKMKISKYIFNSNEKIFCDSMQVEPEKGKGLTCYVNRVYINSTMVGPGNIPVLDSFAAVMKRNPELRLKIESASAVASMWEQQVLWNISNSTINYLVEKQGISADRFLFYYGGLGVATEDYKGIKNVPMLKLTFATDGEEGPSRVEPPMPFLHH